MLVGTFGLDAVRPYESPVWVGRREIHQAESEIEIFKREMWPTEKLAKALKLVAKSLPLYWNGSV